MAALAFDSLLSRLLSTSPPPLPNPHSQAPMWLLSLLCLLPLCFISISLVQFLRRGVESDPSKLGESSSSSCSIFGFGGSPSSFSNARVLIQCPLVVLFQSLISRVFKMESWAEADSRCGGGGSVGVEGESVGDGSELGGVDLVGKEGEEEVKRKKKRGKKKRSGGFGGFRSEDVVGVAESELRALEGKNGADSFFYPFTSSSSATQRKIKAQYDQIVKSHDSKALTLAQVTQFVNCLVEARNELQHKSEIIQRKFTITKAMLYRADRSSLVRFSQQMYKLEAEQKRLEEDALVYNRLQEQLKLSPAYRQMIEISVRMEQKASSDQLVDTTDAEFASISFEELLAQEKKDTFWQRNGKLRSCSN